MFTLARLRAKIQLMVERKVFLHMVMVKGMVMVIMVMVMDYMQMYRNAVKIKGMKETSGTAVRTAIHTQVDSHTLQHLSYYLRA